MKTLRDYQSMGYVLSDDITYQSGYVSRKADMSKQIVYEAKGSRKGQFYVLAPCFKSTRYCYRQYLKKGV